MAIKRFYQYLREESGLGVKFEWAIVYTALLRAGLTDREIKARNPEFYSSLVAPKGDSFVMNQASRAVDQILATVKLPSAKAKQDFLLTAKHSKQIGLRETPEPKTDVVMGAQAGEQYAYRISVKLDVKQGKTRISPQNIQLASGQGKSSAEMIAASVKDQIGETLLKKIIARIENLPVKMISVSNLKKAISRAGTTKLQDLGMVTSTGKIVDSANWERWKEENIQIIQSEIRGVLDDPSNIHLRESIIYEALTGEKTMKNQNSVANYVLTPSHFNEIDAQYVKTVAARSSFRIAAKGRDGLTYPTVRIDAGNSLPGSSLQESIITNALSRITGLSANVKSVLIQGWRKFIDTLKTSYTDKIIDEMIAESVKDSDIEVEINY